MAILGHYKIKALIEQNKLIRAGKGETQEDLLKYIQGASYDLRVGDEYYCDGRVHELKHLLEIQPHELVIVTSYEAMAIPSCIAGRFQISAGLSLRGIMAVTGLQLDPGWHGKLFLPLFNLSDTPIHLRHKDHYATVEFADAEDTKPYDDDGHYQGKTSLLDPDVLPRYKVVSGLRELFIKVEDSRKRIERLTQIFYVIAAIMIASMGVTVAAVISLLIK